MLYSFTYIGYFDYKMHIQIFCRNLKYVAGYWNYHIQSILAQNPAHGTYEFDVGTLLDT